MAITEISRRLAALREHQGPPTSRFGAYFEEQREARNTGASKAAPARQARVGTVPTAAKAPTIAPRRAVIPGELRARCAIVMASDAVKGRERQASELLLASCNRNAKHGDSVAIIAELRKRPIDAELDARRAAYEARLAASRQAEASAMWDRAYSSINAIGGR